MRKFRSHKKSFNRRQTNVRRKYKKTTRLKRYGATRGGIRL